MMLSTTIDPDVLALFSERGQRLLSSAARRYPAKDRDTIRRKLTACRCPTSEAVLDFEEFFGGLTVGPEHRPLELGVLFDEPDPDPDDPDDPERTMVPIGRFPRGYTRLFMDERGEVISYFEGIEMKSQSIFSYLEQLAIDYDDRWPEPRFRVSLRPRVGDQLASALHLQRLDAACDIYEAWWEDQDLSLQQISFAESWKSNATFVYGRTLQRIVDVISEALRLNPEVRANINAEPFKDAKWTKKQQRSASEQADSWDRMPGVLRLHYGQQEEQITGTIWIFEQDGQPTVQQHRYDRGKLIGWDTYTPSGGICRDAE